MIAATPGNVQQPTAVSDVTVHWTLWDLVARGANAHPQRDCLLYMPDQDWPEQMQQMSWERLAAHVWEMRCRLAALGASDQRSVVLALPNSPLGIVCWLAIASNGAVVQAVDPDAGTLPLASAIRATRPAAVITHRDNASSFVRALSDADCNAALIIADDLALLRPLTEIAGLPVAASEPPNASAELVAGMLPTSGTSGKPKLVELTHRNYVTSGERLARNSGYSQLDRFYLCSPFFHVNAQMYSCMPAIVAGASIAIVPRFSATRYFDTARRMGATVSSMVAPPMRMALRRALERGAATDSGGLRLIQYGMSMSDADWQAWDRLFPRIEMRQVYGQTESVSAVLGGAPWEPDDRRTIGRPLLGVDAVRLVGEDGGPVADGTPGELWVRGERGRTLMRGYFQDPQATVAAIDDQGWLRTGDIMTRDADGRFAFVGRKMHIVRRAGENLSIYELELMMQSCPLIEDVAIRAETDEMLDVRLSVHVIPKAGFSEDAFNQWCRESIGKRGVPDVIRVHDSFPRTGSGRVIVRELR